MSTRIKLPRPMRAIHTPYKGVHFWMAANSRTHAKTLVKALHRDMTQSVRLTNMVTMDNGHVGVGHAGIVRAKHGFAKRGGG